MDQAETPSPRPRNASRILVLDDDAAVRDSLQILLELEEYSVRTFETVASFLQGLEASCCEPACVILDVHLPDGDGRKVTGHLSARAPRLPIILMSAQNDGTLEQEARASGAFAFLDKPVSQNELFDTVSRAVSAGAV